MRVVIFGVGEYLKKRYGRIKSLFSESEIVAFIDNKIGQDQTEWFDGIQVVNPMFVKKMKYDYIAIASKYYNEMKQQLLGMEVDSTQIISLEKCCGLKNKGILKLNIVKNDYKKKRVLIISVDMNYNGASLAILYAAKSIDKAVYEVTVAVPSIQQELLQTIKSNKINVIVCPSLPYIDHTELYWMKNYDIAIVNTLQNIQIVCELCNSIPVLWWVHEFGKKYKWIYDYTKTYFDEYNDVKKFSKAHIAAVSQWAADVFDYYYPQRVNTILPLGIPDETVSDPKKGIDGKINFAVVGDVNELKAQDLLIEAIQMLPGDIRIKATFFIIGSCDEKNKYVDSVKEKAVCLSNVVFTGVLERKAIREMFGEIDVIVCPSREETLSIAIIEGMMNSKICITTDATGVADFIKDGVSGFVVHSDDCKALSEKIKYVINNYSTLDDMKEAAREVYEKNFSMKSFADRINLKIQETIDEYR